MGVYASQPGCQAEQPRGPQRGRQPFPEPRLTNRAPESLVFVIMLNCLKIQSWIGQASKSRHEPYSTRNEVFAYCPLCNLCQPAHRGIWLQLRALVLHLRFDRIVRRQTLFRISTCLDLLTLYAMIFLLDNVRSRIKCEIRKQLPGVHSQISPLHVLVWRNTYFSTKVYHNGITIWRAMVARFNQM